MSPKYVCVSWSWTVTIRVSWLGLHLQVFLEMVTRGRLHGIW